MDFKHCCYCVPIAGLFFSGVPFDGQFLTAKELYGKVYKHNKIQNMIQVNESAIAKHRTLNSTEESK